MCYTTPHLANIYKSVQNSEKHTVIFLKKKHLSVDVQRYPLQKKC